MLPLQLQAESHIPLYVQLRDQLRALVHSGELRAGDRIPASRELASHLGVHRTTVANAYAELEAEGLIRGHVGRGTFICGATAQSFSPAPLCAPPALENGRIRWEALFADERAEEVLSRIVAPIPAGAIAFTTSAPAPEFFPLEDFRRCCNAVLSAPGRAVLRLGSSDGYEPLKSALIEMLRAEGLHVRPSQLLITNGCQQTIDLLCKAFLRPADAVAVENPGYPGAIAAFSSARARPLAIPFASAAETRSSGNGHRTRGGAPFLNLEALEVLLLQNRVKFIFVTPDYHNPTGTTLAPAQRRRLIEIAARFQVPVIEDAIYARLRLRGAPVPSLKALDRAGAVVQMDSFSKIAFPGLRVGWCIAPENVTERLRLVKQTTDLHTDQLSQAALAEFIRRGHLGRHLARMRKVYSTRLAALEAALEKHMPEGVCWTRPEGGMSLWLTLPPGLDAGELLIHARERGVLFVPGRLFYSRDPEPNTLRLGFANVDEKSIARGAHLLADVIKAELRKRNRGGVRLRGPADRAEAQARVALV